jgi:hypothetical protein
MKLDQIIRELNLAVLTTPKEFAEIEPSGGYCSDLLSCVMAGAPRQGIWITLQAHGNIVAVAALLDLCAVIITEGAEPDAATIAKANQEGITLLSTSLPNYPIVGQLWEKGIRVG